MDTTTLEHFLVLAQIGNMTRASQQLRLTQPALSGQLKRLEDELGGALFLRRGRGLSLTPAGEVFRRHAMDALACIAAGREAVVSTGSLASGTLSIGGGATSTTCLLPQIVGAFHAQHPGVRFTIREAPSRSTAEAVISGELDLGVVTLPLSARLADRVIETPWLTDELVLMVPPGHPLGGRRGFRWSDLDRQNLIAFESGSAVRALLDRLLAEHGVIPAVVMELRSITAIVRMVGSGIGCGFISRLADPAGPGLRCLDRPLRRQLALVERNNGVRSRAHGAFREALLAYRPEPGV